MAYNSFGATPAEREQQRKAVLYEVAARVSAFLEEDGPEKHGFEYVKASSIWRMISSTR